MNIINIKEASYSNHLIRRYLQSLLSLESHIGIVFERPQKGVEMCNFHTSREGHFIKKMKRNVRVNTYSVGLTMKKRL